MSTRKARANVFERTVTTNDIFDSRHLQNIRGRKTWNEYLWTL